MSDKYTENKRVYRLSVRDTGSYIKTRIVQGNLHRTIGDMQVEDNIYADEEFIQDKPYFTIDEALLALVAEYGFPTNREEKELFWNNYKDGALDQLFRTILEHALYTIIDPEYANGNAMPLHRVVTEYGGIEVVYRYFPDIEEFQIHIYPDCKSCVTITFLGFNMQHIDRIPIELCNNLTFLWQGKDVKDKIIQL